jgi:nucleoid-associated protein Lsr2
MDLPPLHVQHGGAVPDVRVSSPARAGRRCSTAAIREWAREHGHKVSDRGRIPKSVIEAYQTAS